MLWAQAPSTLARRGRGRAPRILPHGPPGGADLRQPKQTWRATVSLAPSGPSGGYTQKEAACVKLRYCSREGSKTPLTCQASEAPPCRLWSPRDRRYH